MLAGYPQVIGTLWPIEDSAGYIITEQVYQGMSEPDEPTEPGAHPAPLARLAGPALHATTVGLRSQLPGDPVIWAAHIHAGA